MKRVLIANRGEIALRVLRTLRAMGIESVVVVSEADCSSPAALEADHVVEIGPAPAAESYLDVQKILAAVKESDADGLHPGYGFLSENVALAEALEDAGVTFIGPGTRAIEAMGDKSAARETATAAGVDPVPGHEGADDDDTLRTEAERIGYPLLVKAAMGGGGKGMRRVDEAAGLDEAIRAARREATAAFGDGKLLLERYVERARHVEVQILADRHGTVLPIFERECSLQRRHQKVIEECPSVAVDAALREKMGAAAVRLARAVDYVGAGTVEFLLEDSGAFWFLEMNTRLQVEHPVTECVAGLDLVAWQVRIARGEKLPEDLVAGGPRGHAIEARLYAEDPASGFLPQSGPLLALRWPEGPGIRIDAGFREGQEVTPHYDPMLAKVIASGATREEARQRLIVALRELVVLGLVTNADYLVHLLETEAFREGQTFTRTLDGLGVPDAADPADALLLAAAALSGGTAEGASTGVAGDGDADRFSPFLSVGPLRIVQGDAS